jgi:hypothetical protein
MQHQEETYFSYRTSLPQDINRRGKTSNTLRRFTEVVPLGESLPGERLWTVRGEGADYKPFLQGSSRLIGVFHLSYDGFRCYLLLLENQYPGR